MRCLTCGGGEESDGLDSSFCDIAALGGDTVGPDKPPKTIVKIGQAAGRNGKGSARPLIWTHPARER